MSSAAWAGRISSAVRRAVDPAPTTWCTSLRTAWPHAPATCGFGCCVATRGEQGRAGRGSILHLGSCLERFDELLGEKQERRPGRVVLLDRDRPAVKAGRPHAVAAR